MCRSDNLRLVRCDRLAELAELDEHWSSKPVMVVSVVSSIPTGTTLFFAKIPRCMVKCHSSGQKLWLNVTLNCYVV